MPHFNLCRKFLFSLFAMLVSGFGLLATANAAPVHNAPAYQDFPVSPYQGATAALNLHNNAAAKPFRSQLIQALQQKPNFAGHYVLTTWGCGAFCTTLAIVDSKTGKAYLPHIGQNDASWQNYVLGWQPETPRVNSKLLVIQGQLTTLPRANPAALKGPFRHATLYYVWENNRLILVKRLIVNK